MAHLFALVEVGASALLLARNAFSNRVRYFKRASALFDHGAGAVPPGFTNETMEHYARPFDEVKSAIEPRYEII